MVKIFSTYYFTYRIFSYWFGSWYQHWFKGLPKEYYADWLEVANDEIKHFLMLEELLTELGGKYGDFPVHKNLFEAMEQTTDFWNEWLLFLRFLGSKWIGTKAKIMEKIKF